VRRTLKATIGRRDRHGGRRRRAEADRGAKPAAAKPTLVPVLIRPPATRDADRPLPRSLCLPAQGDNVILYKGWFSATLPEWSTKNPGPVAFMHIDCDIYSSTVDILRDLVDQIGPRTVVVFDEYFNYPNWENHEYKAWKEFAESQGVTYTNLAFARQQVAIRVEAVGTTSSNTP
jgi:Macrocin-O-methyltransferase (TylF)